MNYYFWTFSGLALAALTLYIISIFQIKHPAFIRINKITRILLLPFLSAIFVTFLWDRLPDSYGIILYTIISTAVISVSRLFFIFKDSRICKTTGRFFLFAYAILWAVFYHSTFYVYYTSNLGLTVAIVISVAILILLMVAGGKQKFSFYFKLFLANLPLVVFNMEALLTVLLSRKLYSLFLILGTFTFIFTELFFLHSTARSKTVSDNTQTKALSENKKAVIMTILITAFHQFICASAFLMVY